MLQLAMRANSFGMLDPRGELSFKRDDFEINSDDKSLCAFLSGTLREPSLRIAPRPLQA